MIIIINCSNDNSRTKYLSGRYSRRFLSLYRVKREKLCLLDRDLDDFFDRARPYLAIIVSRFEEKVVYICAVHSVRKFSDKSRIAMITSRKRANFYRNA